MIYLELNKCVKEPIYMQIYDQIKKLILTYKINYFDILPSERQFEDIYNVSNFVVKRVYKMLEEENLIIRIKGKGTFVNYRIPYTAKLFQPEITIYPKAHDFIYHTLVVNKIKANTNLNRIFQTTSHDFYYNKRVIVKNHTIPVAFFEIYTSKKYSIFDADFDFYESNIKNYLEKELDMKIEFTSMINAGSADTTTSELLFIDKWSPIMIVNTNYYNKDKTVVLHIKTFYPGSHSYIEAITP